MRRTIVAFFISASLLALAPAQDRTLTLGGAAGWPRFSRSFGIATGKGRLGRDALVLATRETKRGAETDLFLSFDGPEVRDETGRYAVVSSALLPAPRGRARLGGGAGLSNTTGSGLTLRGKPGSFFSTPGDVGSFTIEFWLQPAVTENGSLILSWRSSRNEGGSPVYQYARAIVFRNHLEWTFSNVWTGPNPEVTLVGRSPLIPRAWSHHLVSYDAVTGLLEYRVDGSAEDIKYLTSTGRERGEVYQARFGTPADLELVPRFSGLIDEFRVARVMASEPSLEGKGDLFDRYPRSGGRFETGPIDLGAPNSALRRIDVVIDEPAETGSAFFARAGDNIYEWTDDWPEWKPVVPGARVEGLVGRYAQVAGELYPDGRGSRTPTLSSVTVSYLDDEPPWPPAKVFAEAGDGSVTLRWKASVDFDAKGYLVYYGERPGEYLAAGSPIDAGNALEFVVTGLRNGRIYYFAVAAYDAAGPLLPGEVSREAHARPIKGRE